MIEALSESPEPETSVTPYHAQAQRHWQPSFPEEYWPITNRYTQSHHSGMVNRENAFAGMAAPTPSSGKHLFSDGALRNLVLTDCKQTRSTTGETTRAGHTLAQARFTR